jgi:hypothetical protein
VPVVSEQAARPFAGLPNHPSASLLWCHVSNLAVILEPHEAATCHCEGGSPWQSPKPELWGIASSLHSSQ